VTFVPTINGLSIKMNVTGTINVGVESSWGSLDLNYDATKNVLSSNGNVQGQLTATGSINLGSGNTLNLSYGSNGASASFSAKW
jgi:hypothetical protein